MIYYFLNKLKKIYIFCNIIIEKIFFFYFFYILKIIVMYIYLIVTFDYKIIKIIMLNNSELKKYII